MSHFETKKAFLKSFQEKYRKTDFQELNLKVHSKLQIRDPYAFQGQIRESSEKSLSLIRSFLCRVFTFFFYQKFSNNNFYLDFYAFEKNNLSTLVSYHF